MSELSPLGTLCADADHKPFSGTVGPAVGSTLVCVARLSEDGESEDGVLKLADAGEEGELLVHGPQACLGYYNNPEATEKAFAKDETGTRWLRTGDVAVVDDSGFVYIMDRTKELIKYKGFQVAPAELEATLLTNDRVVDAAVIPVADEVAGEVPRAVVVRSTEAPLLTEQEVVDFVNGRVAPYKRIRGGVVFTDRIPKTESGKILRRVVREQDRQNQAVA